MLNASRRSVNKNTLTWWYVLKTPWIYLCKTSVRRLEDVLKTSVRRLEDVLKTFLEDVWKTFWRRLDDALKTSWKRLQNALKTSWSCLEDVWLRRILIKPSWRHLEEVFWRRKAQANIFVLIKTSSSRQMLPGF